MYKRNIQGWQKHIDFIICDVIALQVAFVLAYFISRGSWAYVSLAYRELAVIFVMADILIAASFNTMHNVLYRDCYHECLQTLKQVLLVLSVMTLYIFSTQKADVYSRATVCLTSVFHLILGFVFRQVWKPVISKIGKGSKKATMILVANENLVPEIVSKINPTDDVEYTGLVLSNRDGTGEEISGIKVVANLQNAADYICREWVDEVFVYPSHFTDIELDSREKENIKSHRESEVALLIEGCRQMAIPVHIRLPIPNIEGKSLTEKVGGYNVLTITSNYASPLQLAIKRLMDIAGGIVGSLIAVIIIAVVGHKIQKESPGPILFKQTRVGQNGKKFQMYKLRSMYLDAEDRKRELLKENRVSDGMMFKLDWDPRIVGNKIVNGKKVTGIGEKIRSGSWDEWPQFFNILMGQMSMVGTRPPTVDEWEKYKYHHRARLATKPGLTGLWQVSGRSKITDFEEVVRLDAEYINHWSIALDIKILFKTLKAVSTRDGAM